MKVKTLIESLRMINRKLGGTVEPNEDVKSLVSEIADNFESGGGGGSSLPSVTAADNDKVLTVVAGSWDKAAPAKELPTVTADDNGKIMGVVGGMWGKTDRVSDVAIFNMYDYSTAENPDTMQYVVYVTLSQIKAAWNAHKICLARYSFSNGSSVGGYTYFINGFYHGEGGDGPESPIWELYLTMNVTDEYSGSEVSKMIILYATVSDEHPYPSTSGDYWPD